MTPEEEAELAALEAEFAQAQQARQGGSTGRGVARMLGQGLSLGYMDELAAGLAAGGAKLGGDERPFGDIYSDIHQAENEGMQRFKQERPWTAGLAEAGGAIATAPALAMRGAAMTAKGLGGAAAHVPRWVAPVAAGSLEGAAYGAGSAQPGERGTGAAVGAGIGVAAGGGIALGQKLLATPLKYLWRQLTAADTPDAQRIVVEALRGMGMSADDVARAMHQLGPDARLMDLGDQVQQLGKAAAQNAPTGRALQAGLAQRHRGQYEDLMGLFAQHTSMPLTRGNTKRVLDDITDKARATVRPIYEQFYGNPVMLSKNLRDILTDPSMSKIFKEAAHDARMENLLNRSGSTRPNAAFNITQKDLARRNQPLMTEHVDYIQRALRTRADDLVGKTVRGIPSKAVKLRQMRQAILDEVDPAFPEFKQARDTWAGRKSLERAVDSGKKFFTLSDDKFDDFMSTINPMEREGFMMGLHDAVRQGFSRIKRGNDLSIIAKLDSPQFKDRLTTLMGKSRTDAFLESIDVMRRKAMSYRATQGSQTAPLQKIMRDIGGGSTQAYAGDLARGDLVGAAGRATRDLFHNVDPPPGMMDEMARILMDPQGWQGLSMGRRAGRPMPPLMLPAAAGGVANAGYNQFRGPQ